MAVRTGWTAIFRGFYPDCATLYTPDNALELKKILYETLSHSSHDVISRKHE